MIYTIQDKYMSEWKTICKAFAKKVGAELVFVNDTGMGLMFPNGDMQHIYIDEMMDML